MKNKWRPNCFVVARTKYCNFQGEEAVKFSFEFPIIFQNPCWTVKSSFTLLVRKFFHPQFLSFIPTTNKIENL